MTFNFSLQEAENIMWD